MKLRREEKRDSQRVEALRKPFGRRVDRHAQFGQDLGASRIPRGRAVPVLGDLQTRCAADNCRRGGDIERIGTVATRSTRVDHALARD